MTIDPTYLYVALKWIGGGLVTFLTVLGGSQIFTRIFDRYLRKKDARNETISQYALEYSKSLNDRVNKMEERYDEQGGRLMAAMLDTARLQGENNLLTEKLSLITQENTDLKRKLTQSKTENTKFRSQVRELTARLDETMLKLTEALTRIDTLERERQSRDYEKTREDNRSDTGQV